MYLILGIEENYLRTLTVIKINLIDSSQEYFFLKAL